MVLEPHLTNSGDSMNKPHKHADLIKAWADGAIIEGFIDGMWIEARPTWNENAEYRIKPEPKPDLHFYVNHLMISLTHLRNFTEYKFHVKLTFDGETKKLKSVEMIK